VPTVLKRLLVIVEAQRKKSASRQLNRFNRLQIRRRWWDFAWTRSSDHIRRLGGGRLECFEKLFPDASVAVDVLPRSFHSVLIVGHQMQFMFGVGIVLRLEKLGTGLAYLPH
jgi:hypothetical protein